MDTNSPDLMSLLTRKLGYDSQKLSVYSENIANSSTPNYKALEVTPFGDVLKQTMSMTTTDPKHIIPASMAGANSKTVKVKDNDVLPNGNNVDVEGDMMKISSTSVDNQMLTSIYKAFNSLFRIAVKGS